MKKKPTVPDGYELTYRLYDLNEVRFILCLCIRLMSRLDKKPI